MKKLIFTLVALLSLNFMYAQEESRFFATMSLHHAKALEKELPNEVTILSAKGNEAAVYMSELAGHKLHDRILVHGPGYIYKASHAEALSALQLGPKPVQHRMPFTITEDAVVNETLDLISTQNIEDQIMELEDYGTRYHTMASATQAAIDLKAKWEAMAASYGRTDVSVRLYNHSNTNMPSVIMTIEGAETPSEFVIVGGHLDSTSNQGNNNAPGADDDASGIATITEAARSLFEVGFVPKRTIEVMAYAAEEIGLVGSAEIAQEYSNNGTDVVAYVQFDMTNFNGSANDISFITDFTDATLNGYLMSLVDHYNTTGDHQFTYGTSLCNYGCSDHASWNNQGFMASFPFEADFGQHNGNIHTAGDVFSVSGTAEHAAKFSKLCVEFLIEVSKSNEILGIDELDAAAIAVSMENSIVSYNVAGATVAFKELRVYNIQGKEVKRSVIINGEGSFSMQNNASGVYVVTFFTERNLTVSKKVIVD